MLVQAKADTDDGSLHEAARLGDHDTVSFLLNSRHDPNHPSPLHDLQSVLEVAIRCHQLVSHPEKLKSIIKLLYNKGANSRYQADGKSLLIIALDVEHADKTISPLLDAFMRSMINEEFNLYCEQGLVYSPISYVKMNKQKSPDAQRETLMKILSASGCKEVYYHEKGPQPEGYIGAPKYLVRREQERQDDTRREEEAKKRHEAELGRLEEMAAARTELKRLELEAEEMERDRSHKATIARHKEMEKLQLKTHAEIEASLKRQYEIQLHGEQELHGVQEVGLAARLKTEKRFQEMTLKNYKLAQSMKGKGSN